MLDILFVSDYVCPYCLVAKTAMKRVLEKENIEARISYQPYELTEEPEPRVDTYHDENRRAHYKVLEEPCAQMGIKMHLPPNVVPRPYTRLAFEGWYFACDKDKGDEYNDAVMDAYFVRQEDIGDVDVLLNVAASVGLNREELWGALQTGVYTKRVKDAVSFAKNTLRVRGVPTIYVNGDRVKLSSYTEAEMSAILNAANGVETENPSDGCGEDGCKF